MENPASPPPSSTPKGNAFVQWLQTATGVVVAITGFVAAVIGLFALFKNVIPHHSGSEIVGTWRDVNYPAELIYRFSLADDGKRIIGVETGMMPPNQPVGPIQMVGTRSGNNVDLEIVSIPGGGPPPVPGGYHLVMAEDGKTLTGIIYPQAFPPRAVILVKIKPGQP
jgi:hypothetical protein